LQLKYRGYHRYGKVYEVNAVSSQVNEPNFEVSWKSATDKRSARE